MDILSLKIQRFEAALKSFEAVTAKDLNDEFFRDSAIQRFEYTTEIFWKLLKVLLRERFDIVTFSPREAVKEACGQGILTNEESEIILKMLRVRNETSHDYALEIAETLIPELPGFAKLLRDIFGRIPENVQ